MGDFRTASAALTTLMLAIALNACGGDSGPTSPTDVSESGSDVVGFEVLCPTSLLIGERAPCIASARLRSGQTPLVSFAAAWSSARSDVVSVDSSGTVRGQAGGEATITATYQGRIATALVIVTAEDAIRVRAAAHQGDFAPGSTVTMWLQGYYSVASADSGVLRLRITDQDGIVTMTTPTTVARGGDFFLLSSTFVIPQNSVQVCRTAVLEVGSTTITQPQSNESGLWCIAVRR